MQNNAGVNINIDNNNKKLRIFKNNKMTHLDLVIGGVHKKRVASHKRYNEIVDNLMAKRFNSNQQSEFKH